MERTDLVENALANNGSIGSSTDINCDIPIRVCGDYDKGLDDGVGIYSRGLLWKMS